MKEKEVDLLSPPGGAPSRGESAVLSQPPIPNEDQHCYDLLRVLFLLGGLIIHYLQTGPGGSSLYLLPKKERIRSEQNQCLRLHENVPARLSRQPQQRPATGWGLLAALCTVAKDH